MLFIKKKNLLLKHLSGVVEATVKFVLQLHIPLWHEASVTSLQLSSAEQAAPNTTPDGSSKVKWLLIKLNLKNHIKQ